MEVCLIAYCFVKCHLFLIHLTICSSLEVKNFNLLLFPTSIFFSSFNVIQTTHLIILNRARYLCLQSSCSGYPQQQFVSEINLFLIVFLLNFVQFQVSKFRIHRMFNFLPSDLFNPRTSDNKNVLRPVRLTHSSRLPLKLMLHWVKRRMFSNFDFCTALNHARWGSLGKYAKHWNIKVINRKHGRFKSQ